jgi:type VI secretion system protein ImpM
MTRPRGARPGQSPAYYGKLPVRADFVGRRLPRPTLEHWDGWLQQCLACSQAVLGAAWDDHYLTAPAWRFALPARVCGEAALIGVLVPSVDAVGRCFPLLLAQELPESAEPTALAAEATPWFEAAEALSLEALSIGFDLAALDHPLPAPTAVPLRPPADPAAAEPVGLWVGLPMLSALRATLARTPGIGPRSALWWTGGGGGFRPGLAVTIGLIPPAGFTALLDDSWTSHGWRSIDDTAPATSEIVWDRDA